MDQDEINRVARLLDDYIQKIEDLPERKPWRRGLYGFTDYLNKKVSSAESRGVRRANIWKVSTDLTGLRVKGYHALDAVEKKQYAKLKETAERFFGLAQRYLDYLKDLYLEGQSFYLYHLYIDRYYGEPQLGRVVLAIQEKQQATLTNLPTKRNYRGAFRIAQGRYVFDLRSENDEQLHIKVKVFNDDKQEVFLGGYITFDEDHIVTGSLILEKCQESDPQPVAISWHNALEELNSVNLHIKEYLYLKNLSYQETPNRVDTFAELKRFLRMSNETWSTRFFEIDRPILFIAAPTKSIDKTIFDNRQSHIQIIVGRLRERFAGILDIRNVDKHLSILEGNNHFSSTAFNILKRTRIFVLILTKTKKHSFSLVQLGWAIAHCKNIIICYEKGCISDNLKSLIKLNRPSHNRIKMFRFKDIETHYEDLYEEIQNAIIGNINHFLDDNHRSITGSVD